MSLTAISFEDPEITRKLARMHEIDPVKIRELLANLAKKAGDCNLSDEVMDELVEYLVRSIRRAVISRILGHGWHKNSGVEGGLQELKTLIDQADEPFDALKNLHREALEALYFVGAGTNSMANGLVDIRDAAFRASQLLDCWKADAKNGIHRRNPAGRYENRLEDQITFAASRVYREIMVKRAARSSRSAKDVDKSYQGPFVRFLSQLFALLEWNANPESLTEKWHDRRSRKRKMRRSQLSGQ